MTQNKEYILCIGSGIWQMPSIAAMHRLGYGIIAVDLDPNAPGFKLADHVINLSAHDPAPVFQALTDMEFDLSSIILVFTTASRGCITTAAELAGKLGVTGPGIAPESTDILVDRDRFRNFLRENGLPSPHSQVVSDASQVNGLEYPLVVKSNVNTSGSAGINLVENSAGLPAAIAAAQKAGKTDYAIVEDFLPGEDLGVFGVFHRGKPFFITAIQRRVHQQPHFLPAEYLAPAEMNNEIYHTYTRLGECLKVTAGPFYVEFRISEKRKKCYPIECEPTVPAHIDYLVSNSAGIQTAELVILSLLNKIEEIPEISVDASAGCRFVYADKPGTIREFTVPELDSSEGSLIVRKKTGDYVRFETAGDVCAMIYTHGKTRHDVETLLNNLANELILVTE